MPENGYSIHKKLRQCNGCGKKGYYVMKTHHITVAGKKIHCGTMRIVKGEKHVVD